MTVAYVDASAIVKLIVAEAESEALVSSLAGYDAHVTSVIAQVEVPRAVRRTGLDPDLVVTNDVLSRFATVLLDRSVIDMARDIDPARIRTLDAIHLASAISLGIEDLVFVAYDERCLEGAGHAGLASLHPADPRPHSRHIVPRFPLKANSTGSLWLRHQRRGPANGRCSWRQIRGQPSIRHEGPPRIYSRPRSSDFFASNSSGESTPASLSSASFLI